MRRLLIFLLLLIPVSIAPAGIKSFTIIASDLIVYISMADVDIWLSEFDIQYRNIVRAQVILETGHLTSYICKVNKNLIGMRYPKVRPTTATGSHEGHAVYDSFRASIEDYYLWQKTFYKDKEDYFAFLRRMQYATDGSYVNKLKTLM